MPLKPDRHEIWSDAALQWSLEEDPSGALWMAVVIYEGFTASAADVKLNDTDAARCRKSRAAAGHLAERIFRSKGRYP